MLTFLQINFDLLGTNGFIFPFILDMTEKAIRLMMQDKSYISWSDISRVKLQWWTLQWNLGVIAKLNVHPSIWYFYEVFESQIDNLNFCKPTIEGNLLKMKP